MNTQGSRERGTQRSELTPTQVLEKMGRRQDESDRIEMNWLQMEAARLQRRIDWLSSKMRQRNTDKMPPVANPTPNAFKIAPEEWQSIATSLTKGRQGTPEESGPPTTQRGNPDIALEATVILSLKDIDKGPIETVCTSTASDDSLLILLDRGVKEHIEQHRFMPSVIEMPKLVIDMLALINITEYVTANTHIPFVKNDSLSVNTIKLITLLI